MRTLWYFALSVLLTSVCGCLETSNSSSETSVAKETPASQSLLEKLSIDLESELQKKSVSIASATPPNFDSKVIEKIIAKAISEVERNSLTSSDDLTLVTGPFIAGALKGLGEQGITDTGRLPATTILKTITNNAISSMSSMGLPSSELAGLAGALTSEIIKKMGSTAVNLGLSVGDLSNTIGDITTGAINGLKDGMTATEISQSAKEIVFNIAANVDEISLDGYSATDVSGLIEEISTSSIAELEKIDGFTGNAGSTTITEMSSQITAALDEIEMDGFDSETKEIAIGELTKRESERTVSNDVSNVFQTDGLSNIEGIPPSYDPIAFPFPDIVENIVPIEEVYFLDIYKLTFTDTDGDRNELSGEVRIVGWSFSAPQNITYCRFYWADENGAPISTTSFGFTTDIQAPMIIPPNTQVPDGAKSIAVRVEFNNNSSYSNDAFIRILDAPLEKVTFSSTEHGIVQEYTLAGYNRFTQKPIYQSNNSDTIFSSGGFWMLFPFPLDLSFYIHTYDRDLIYNSHLWTQSDSEKPPATGWHDKLGEPASDISAIVE